MKVECGMVLVLKNALRRSEDMLINVHLVVADSAPGCISGDQEVCLEFEISVDLRVLLPGREKGRFQLRKKVVISFDYPAFRFYCMPLAYRTS